MAWAMSWWGLLAGGVFSPWIYGQREGWKEGLNHLYCPTYSRGPFICSVQNIANMYCTECIIGIVQNAGTPSRLRFARTRRDEGGIEPPVLSYILQRPIRSVQILRIYPSISGHLSHDSSRSRRAVKRACELPLGSATEAHS